MEQDNQPNTQVTVNESRDGYRRTGLTVKATEGLSYSGGMGAKATDEGRLGCLVDIYISSRYIYILFSE
jgi:hypothetical protein